MTVDQGVATLRTHIRIDRPADDVYAVISDAGNISDWFPIVQTSTATVDERHCRLQGDVPLDEAIVTDDPKLRRFQYRITGGGVPVDSHLGTVDVIDLDGSSLVVYSTEVTPDGVADTLGPAIEDGVRGLKQYCESRGWPFAEGGEDRHARVACPGTPMEGVRHARLAP